MERVKLDNSYSEDEGFFDIFLNEDEEIQEMQVSKLNMFKDQTWDFSYLDFEERASKNSLIKFQGIPKEYIFYIKTQALKQIKIDGKAFSTINKSIDILKTISKEFINLGLDSIFKVSIDEIEEYLNAKEKKSSFRYLERLTNALKLFLNHVGEIEDIDFDKIVDFLNERQLKYSKHGSKTAVNAYIPDAFCNQLVSCAIKDSENIDLDLDERIVACLIIILAETGMRAEEISQLKTNQLSTYKINNEKQVYFLHFKTFKTNRGNGAELTYCYMTPIAAKAYKLAEILVEQAINGLSEFVLMKRIYELITNQKNLKLKHLSSSHKAIINQLTDKQLNDYKNKLREYLLINSKTGKRRIGTAPLTENYQKFIIRNYSQLSSVDLNSDERKKLNYFQITSKAKYEKMYNVEYRYAHTFEETKKIKYPYVNFHRFRTTVCTKLFVQKVHIDFIIKHMNHISDDMTNYYNKSFQLENKLEKSIEHIKGLIDENGLLITDKNEVSEAYIKNELELKSSVKKIEKINEFLIKNNFNIKRDVKEVLNILKKTNSPGIENEFGMCLRSIIHSVCERRKYFHTFDDNYNLEINLDSYKFLNFEYERFKQKLEVVDYNRGLVEKQPEYSVELDREIKALNKFIDDVLIRQMESLNNDVDIKGENVIIEEYSNLKEIVSNRSEILNEVITWKRSLRE
ncbi:tyrosine-type recombinase/integrase [Halobacillus litoralis]|uniref:tyrosine-type recombinase/integrase n=1 Tax=Halobacillus litoralis TaxID=45668 RepID=UPI00249199CF|nr:tyrosine-type recombinase/integrase [Halobacillus litoralis]